MEFGVWFADEMGHILQSIVTTGDDFAAIASVEGDDELIRAYQAGFHAALRSVAQALNISPPKMKPKELPQSLRAVSGRQRSSRSRGWAPHDDASAQMPGQRLAGS